MATTVLVKEQVTDNVPKRIKELKFGIAASQDILKQSVLEVCDQVFYDTTKERFPTENGPLDSRLGLSGKGSHCGTCGEQMQACMGHFGYVKLALPVLHIGYFKFIIHILQVVCKDCSSLLLPENLRRSFLRELRRPNIDNLRKTQICKKIFKEARKVHTCPQCGGLNGRVKKNGAGPLKVTHEKFSHFEGSKSSKKVAPKAKVSFDNSFETVKKSIGDIEKNMKKAFDDLNPLRILSIFEKITDPDCELLGMNPTEGRPEMFIWRYFPVAPICLRPSVPQEGSTTEDDITNKVAHIVAMNNAIKRGLENGERIGTLMDQWDFLQAQIAMIVNSESPGVTPSGQYVTMRGFCQRLKGKQGRFRGNLSGKRVDFSGRTVISPDPNLGVNEVAIPEAVAKSLTFPEKVSQYNIEKMRQAVQRGTRRWPGAFQVLKAGSNLKQMLKFGETRRHADALKVGDIVERHLVDGDVVLFNRQPSLHKLSIMAHRVRVRPSRTFRLNECVCTPYNADFDGDEMNLHVPQTEEARAEALELMGVEHNLATPRNGEPIIAAIQDFITGAYLLSNKDKFYDRKTFSQICSYMVEGNENIDLPPPAIIKPIRLWTGKQVFNVLLRPNRACKVRISLDAPCRGYREAERVHRDLSENDGWLCIRDSEIMCGVMDKNTIGAGRKDSVFFAVLRDYGEDEALQAMNRLARLISRYLGGQAFSIGVSDVRPGSKLSRAKQQLVKKAYAECDDLIKDFRHGRLGHKKGTSAEQTLEKSISDILTRVRKQAGEHCLVELDKHNTATLMANCGSKGNAMNVSQMVTVVGQQIINQGRVQEGFQDRTLPHYPHNARKPASKGFVRNSFYSGLGPSELFFHAMSGREGLVDTAVKTAETGYMSRRLMKSLEDLSIKYDRTVRNSAESIVQFEYGDDSLDPTSMESEARPVNFEHAYVHSQELTQAHEQAGLEPEGIVQLSVDKLGSYKDMLARMSSHQEALSDPTQSVTEDRISESDRNFLESVENFLASKGRTRANLSTRLEPINLLQLEPSAKKNKGLRKRGRKSNSTRSVRSEEEARSVYADLTTKCSQPALEGFIETCISRYHKAAVQPGTAVGAIGAQSIGEPGTQMTLKTFHFAGIANLQITQGVPRMKEIINASREISTPIITCQLKNKDSMIAARVAQGRIVHTYLRDVVAFVEEVWTDETCHLGLKLDSDTIHELHLEIQAIDVKHAILKMKKLRLASDDIRVYRDYVRVTIKTPYRSEKAAKLKAKEDIHIFTRMQHIIRLLPDISICGHAGASRAIIKMDENKKHSLLVEGYGLKRCLTTGGIDGLTTRTNSVLEMREVLGIEAARTTIIDEIRTVMDGMGIDPRHMQLLADVMTYRGEVLGITRFGLSKMRDSVLQLASFEKTPDHLFEAAWHAKRDKVEGVSECIIFGQSTSQGTGAFAVVRELDIPKASLKQKGTVFEDTWQSVEEELMKG